MAIKAIDLSSVHRLTSGQVVIDLQTAVKELLENAVDAGATSVEIRFREHGLKSFEVLDNGRGIAASDYAGLALKHHTSKLSSFSDLTSVTTLGFRGEALSSLCGVSTSFSVITSTQESAPVGQILAFDQAGNCTVGGKTARQKGTSVKVEGLFGKLPVRRKELEKNLKREFNKAVELCQAYAIVCTGRRIELKNVVKGKPTVHIQTPIAQTVRANFSSIFSPKTAQTMMDLDLTLDVAADKTVLRHSALGDPSRPTSTTVLVKGLVSKPTNGSGRSTGSRQFFYINGRPFNPTKISKAFNEVYKSFNTNSFPCVVADFVLPTDAYDVNVSPDKRTVFLHSEANLVFALKKALEEMFEPTRATFQMRPIAKELTLKEKEKRDREERAQSASQRAPLFNVDSDIEGEDEVQVVVKEEEEDDDESRPSKRARLSPTPSQEPPAREEEDEDEPMPDTSQTLEQNQPQRSQEQEEEDELIPTPPVPSHFPLQRPPPVASTSRDQLSDEEDDELLAPPAQQPHIERDLSPSQLRSDIQAQPYSQRPTLLQMTLDTSGAAWNIRQPAGPGLSRVKPLRRASSGSGSGSGSGASLIVGGGKRVERKGSSELQNAQRLIRSFVHPSEVRRYIDDEAGESGAYDESEEEEEDEVAGETVEDDSEDEVMIVEEGEGETHDDADGAKEVCCDHHSPHRSTVDVDAVEASEHLAELDSAYEGTPAPSAPPSRTYRDEVGRPTVVAVDTTVNFSLDKIARVWARPIRTGAALDARLRKRAMLTSAGDSARDGQREASASAEELRGAAIDRTAEDAEKALSRTVSKEDFERMEVIGQFNLGFIIARRRHGVAEGEDDLFIVDQHASDEKYNFEKLQQDTVIQSQKLLAPRALGLPSHDELTAIEHLAQIQQNGFDLLIDESAPPGERVKLTAQPVSKETTFGVSDLEELLDLCAAAAPGEVVRPSKARRMFASRACRKSVMIGTALNERQMGAVLRHMGTMDQPWSCPHGRPTMRYLANLSRKADSLGDPRDDVFALLQSIKP